jgi:hypothetical protein
VTPRREVVDRALAPVMADIERQHPGLVRVVPAQDSPGVDAWLYERTGGGTGLYLDSISSPLDAVLDMTGRVQEVVLESISGITGNGAWPECPTHPDRSPLDFGQHDGRAYWYCPHDGHVVSEVGRLGPPAEEEDFGFSFPLPDPPYSMTEAEADDLAAEMRRTGALDARVGRIGLRRVVEFSSGENVISIDDPAVWPHLRTVHPPVYRAAPDPRGSVGGIWGPETEDDAD